MKTKMMTIAAAGALAAGLVFAQAQTAPKSQPPAHRNFTARRAEARHHMMQALNLTEAQRQQAKAIFQKARQESQPVVQQLKQDRAALRAAVKANDTAKIQQLSGTEGKLRGQIMADHAAAFAKFYQTLTPAQRAKMDQIRAARMHRTATGA